MATCCRNSCWHNYCEVFITQGNEGYIKQERTETMSSLATLCLGIPLGESCVSWPAGIHFYKFPSGLQAYVPIIKWLSMDRQWVARCGSCTSNRRHPWLQQPLQDLLSKLFLCPSLSWTYLLYGPCDVCNVLCVDKKELYKCKFNVFIYSILKAR